MKAKLDINKMILEKVRGHKILDQLRPKAIVTNGSPRDIGDNLEPLDYEVVASGSSGNCVRISDYLIDCGIPYRDIKESLYKVKYLLLTHIHSDHIRESTYKRLRKEFPHIQTIGNYEIHQRFGVDLVSNNDYPVLVDDRKILPIELKHDVVTQGFNMNVAGHNVIYATDTNNLEKAPTLDPYDYLFIESNHCEKKLNAIRNSSKYGYNAYGNGKRHLSTQKCYEFYYLNRRDRDSELIELHKSSRFY